MIACPTEFVRQKLEFFIEQDGRSISELAQAADALAPGRGREAWRKGISRARSSGWPVPWVAGGLAAVLRIKIASFYPGGPEAQPAPK